jgi:hypothetical protein
MNLIHPKTIIATWLVFTAVMLNAAPEYGVRHIDESLMTNANVVIRKNHVGVKILDAARYRIDYQTIITVLNENGKGSDVMVIPYDSHSTPGFRSGEIYDAQGQLIRKIKNSDLKDYSAIQGISLYEDNRVKVYEPRLNTYPYTVKYEYSISYNNRGIFYADRFSPYSSYNCGVEDAVFMVEYPRTMTIKTKQVNTSVQPELEEKSNTRMATWRFKKLPPIAHEYLNPGYQEIAPIVMLTQEQFVFDGYTGKTNSWADLGKWVWEMNKDRDRLPQHRIAQLQQMVKDLPDDLSKVKAVYEFLQSSTRYVNVAVGIGGFQPVSAMDVDKNNYGDCKALSNYMVAMLKAIGIPSHYTLVYSGLGDYRHVDPDFPASQFNHAIVCVPLLGDTLWLECTSQILPFAYLHDHIDNRHVLIISSQGGQLVRTPAYAPAKNTWATHVDLKLEPTGHARAMINMKRGGIYFGDYLQQVRAAPDDQKKWLYQSFRFPNYTINNFNLSNEMDVNPFTKIDLDINLRSYATVSGERMTIPLAQLLTRNSNPTRMRNRRQPFEILFSKVISDTLHVELPAGYILETGFNDVHIESEFGSYRASFELQGTRGRFIRIQEVTPGIFDPEKYQEYYTYCQNIVRADGGTIVLRKQ